MKSLLWLVLALAIAVNVATSFAFDGAQQIALSVVTGTLAIAAATGIYLKRDRNAA